MPNFDTGHYFLTVLAPIRNGLVEKDGVSSNTSYVQLLRERLAVLPTALQSPATEAIGINSPFARNLRTHLARFVVVNDVVFNGRTQEDPLVAGIEGKDPLRPNKVDKLTTSYLLFSADFDAVTETGARLADTLTEKEQDDARDAYLRRLWDTMRPELTEIFGCCYGFPKDAKRADFVDYVKRCQVETTMPFNDYWLDTPKLPSVSLKAVIAVVAIPALVALLAFLSRIFGFENVWIISLFVALPAGWTLLIAIILTAVAGYLVYRFFLSKGAKAMPPGPYADLPSVLKSLYIQQTFTDFAIAQQGASDADLHAAFGQYLQQNQPEDRLTPSQRPGVISSKRPNAIVTARTWKTEGSV